MTSATMATVTATALTEPHGHSDHMATATTQPQRPHGPGDHRTPFLGCLALTFVQPVAEAVVDDVLLPRGDHADGLLPDVGAVVDVVLKDKYLFGRTEQSVNPAVRFTVSWSSQDPWAHPQQKNPRFRWIGDWRFPQKAT